MCVKIAEVKVLFVTSNEVQLRAYYIVLFSFAFVLQVNQLIERLFLFWAPKIIFFIREYSNHVEIGCESLINRSQSDKKLVHW